MTCPRVSAAEAYRLMCDEGYVYVDVRTVAEFASGHPVGAYNVPIVISGPVGLQENPEFLRVMTACFGRDRALLVGCKGGPRSLRAARALVEAGFARVVEQRAGYAGVRDAFGRMTEPGWEAANLPCATCADAERDYTALRGHSG